MSKKEAEKELRSIIERILSHVGLQSGQSQVNIPGLYSNRLHEKYWEWNQYLEMEEAGKL